MFLVRTALVRVGLRRLGPVGIALTAYDLWRRLPPKQRQRLVAQGRKHGGNAISSARSLIADSVEPRRPTTNVERVFVYWLDAIRRGDLKLIGEHLAEDVVHQGVRPDLVCRNRAEVLENVARTAGQLPQVEAVELVAAGDRVVLSVRAEGIGEPIEEGGERRGGASIVFTLRGETIVDIHDYPSRDDALAAAGAGSFRWA